MTPVVSIFDATHIALLSKLKKKCAKDRGAILLWRLKNDAAILSATQKARKPLT
jgi:hypothetical protein